MSETLEKIREWARTNGLSDLELRKRLQSKVGIKLKTSYDWIAESGKGSVPSKEQELSLQRFLSIIEQDRINDEILVAEKTGSTQSQAEPISLGSKVNGMNAVFDSGAHVAPRRVSSDSPDKQSSSPEKGARATTPKTLYGKTIRDPIHGDIELTPFEIKIIDTADFQRLRHIKQLGTTSLVYPGATHTRFDHSLGTVFVAQTMIDAIHKNHPKPISGETQCLIRTCALLHDITHVPFGHTFEDEGFLFKPHDDKTPQKKSRWDRFLNPSTAIGEAITKEKGSDFLKEVTDYLTTKGDKINNLQYPYVVDIVGNTLCADLLDYLARDAYYTGLKQTFDPRFLKYLRIASGEVTEVDPDGKAKKVKYNDRLAISLIKNNKVRPDVISEVINLLRLRYFLAERVYYHHAKIISSAMVIDAMQAAIMEKPDKFTESYLCNLKNGDDELLSDLYEEGGPIAKKIIGKLRTRALYRPTYLLTYSPPSATDTNHVEKTKIISRFKNNQRDRFDLERSLEKWNKLNDGSIIIYCPEEMMSLKEIETLCLWRDEQIQKLTNVPGDKVSDEATNINSNHLALWKMYVLLERGLDSERQKMLNLSSDCYREFGLNNEIKELHHVDKDPIERYIREWGLSHRDLHIEVLEVEQLCEQRSINAKPWSKSVPPTDSELTKTLRDIRSKNNRG